MAGLFTFVCLALYAASSHARTVQFTMDAGCRGGVHYDIFGCFSRNYPFNNTRELPQNPDFVSTTFSLFTRRNPRTPQLLSARDHDGGASVTRSNLDPRRPVKVIIHGFLQNDRSPWVLDMTQALLQRDNVNVITVNWGLGAGFPYTQAAANVRVVGAELAGLITLMGQQRSIPARSFHLIGHSLGAHVAGDAGSQLEDTLGRISGLDPADPNFSYQPPQVRLDPTDARWVDVIHTDGANYTTYGGYGTLQPMGHVDFYPNGGLNQPGCHTDTSVFSFVRDAYHDGMTNAEYAMACSHDRAFSLYIESISSPCHFTAYPCDSADDFRAGRCLRCGNRPCPSMGYEADMYKTSGNYYLNTTSGSLAGSSVPLCGYHYLVQVTLADGMPSASGALHVRIVGDRGTTPSLELHRGAMTAGDVITHVLLSPVDVGHVTGMRVRLEQSGGFFNWMSSSDVTFKNVMVEGIYRRNTMYFCPEMATVSASQPLDLANGNTQQGPCFQ